jgi:hypothetical protein
LSKELGYGCRPYLDSIEFGHLEPPESDVLFPGAVGGVVNRDPMDQVDLVVTPLAENRPLAYTNGQINGSAARLPPERRP